VALSKQTPVTERVALAFRAEAFNLTNTPYFRMPSTNLGAADVGVISDSMGERQMQFALRLVF
jgi:hypothetical protein